MVESEKTRWLKMKKSESERKSRGFKSEKTRSSWKGENPVVEKLENPMVESEKPWVLKVRKLGGWKWEYLEAESEKTRRLKLRTLWLKVKKNAEVESDKSGGWKWENPVCVSVG